MGTISHRELRTHSAEVLRRVEAGETLVVTNHGRPVARLSPVQKSVLQELEEAGQVRRATGRFTDLLDVARAPLPDGVTTAGSIAGVRGYDRGY